MNRTQLSRRLLVTAGKLLAVLCPIMMLLLLSHASLVVNAASAVRVERQTGAAEVPTVPTVPTASTPLATATPLPTATTTPLPTATTTPSPTPTTVNPTVSYTIIFQNITIQIIVDAKIVITVPPFTTFNLAGSTPGWICPNGVTAGNQCEYHFGNVPPEQAAVIAAAANAPLKATAVLNILKNQLPADAKGISLDAKVVDINGTVYATYHLTEQIPGRYQFFLPLIHH